MTVVVDASVVFAALIDDSPQGSWAVETLSRAGAAAPHLMPVEVAAVLRRSVQSGSLAVEVASQAHADLLDLPVELFAYGATGARSWQLRSNVTSYDAAYVALAEELDVPLATLDARLRRASGPRCTFLAP